MSNALAACNHSVNVRNCVFLLAQMYAFVFSRSLSMMVLFVDLMLDKIPGFVVGLACDIIRLKDRIRYPVGRQRSEGTVGRDRHGLFDDGCHIGHVRTNIKFFA